MAVVVGLDFGTESARALVVDAGDGRVRGSAVVAYPHGVIDERLPDSETVLGAEWALQHPDDWLTSLEACVRQALTAATIDASEVIGLGVDASLFVFRLEGHFVGVEADEVELILREARGELGFSAAARERFRMNVLRRFYSDYGETLARLAVRSFEEVERVLRRDGVLTGFLDLSGVGDRPLERVFGGLGLAGVEQRRGLGETLGEDHLGSRVGRGLDGLGLGRGLGDRLGGRLVGDLVDLRRVFERVGHRGIGRGVDVFHGIGGRFRQDSRSRIAFENTKSSPATYAVVTISVASTTIV